MVLWAVDCAGHVIHCFENIRPEDDRPRRALEAGRAWVRGELSMGMVRNGAFAAHAAARDTDHAAANTMCLCSSI